MAYFQALWKFSATFMKSTDLYEKFENCFFLPLTKKSKKA